MTSLFAQFRYAVGAAALSVVVTAPVRAGEPAEIFERRIVPILKSPNPSSCTQCHLGGVDLKDYLMPSHEKTFLSLRDQGLIDVAKPEQSKILQLIQRGNEDTSKNNIIHAKTRQLEYEAMMAWVKASAADPKLREQPPLPKKERARPAVDDAVIRHERKDHLLASFEQTVWALRFRCMNCHTEGTPQNQKNVEKFGERVAWVKGNDASTTMAYLLGSKLIDVKEPDKSLLLQKPLNTVKHEGGVKFLFGDQGYKAFRTWIEDVAAMRGGKYRMASDLPTADERPLQFGSEMWFKLEETPPAWGDKLLQVEIFAWDDARKAWETDPIATSDRGVWGKGKLWQHVVTLLAPSGSERAMAWKKGKPALSPGRYLVKVYVDRDGRLGKDWKARLDGMEYVGQAEFMAKWREGYDGMTVVDSRKVKP